MTVFIAMEKLPTFMSSHFLTVNFTACTNGVQLRKSWARQFKAGPFTFSSLRFRVTYSIMLRSLISLEMSFVQGDEYGSIWIILHIVIQLDKHLLKILSFIQCAFLASL